MSAAWEDATTYGRSFPRGSVEPRVWTLDLGVLRITLHRWQGLESWFVTCHQAGIDKRELGATTIEGLKAEAFSAVAGHVAAMQRALTQVQS